MFYNGVAELAGQRDVPFIDFNDTKHYREIGLDIEKHFYDQRHLNEAGMKKFVPYFSTFIMQ